jgi:RNA polymerase sigma-70 factor (ECF subfamily)
MEKIYNDSARSVFRYLFSMTHDEDLSEELTQETFYRAVYSIGRYDGSCKMSVWLCQIAKHIWYQELDKRSRRKTGVLTEDIPAPDGTPDEQAILHGEKEALYQAIHKLDDPMREVVYMRLSSEFSFAEIGDILKKNENWARVTYYRAKQKLAEILK